MTEPLSYSDFIERKSQADQFGGFEPLWMPEFLYDFQSVLVDWAIRKGKAALFADCGLGKSPMQLVWAENVVRHTNKPVLIATPLAVSYQLVREAEKFNVRAVRSIAGELPTRPQIVITNYERLEHFDARDFAGMVCDESSILKCYMGVRRRLITRFMSKMHYRLLCTATAAPNDYIELGTSSEALGYISHSDMLERFFKQIQSKQIKRFTGGHGSRNDMHKAQGGWRFRGHAETPFWRWVCSWARALRRPSDLGFSDDRFVLPELIERETVVSNTKPLPGLLFSIPARGLSEQREERRNTIEERCEKVAELASHDAQSLIWCHLNAEGDRLEELIPDAQQVAGSDADEVKEERLIAFANGQLQRLITKPKIGAWGLNLQGCAHMTFFPSHSYEQYYQGTRRCWRFGQTRPVVVDIVTSEGESQVMHNLQRKAQAADQMFEALQEHMTDALHIEKDNRFTERQEVPTWL
jgi:hypothetical protein